MVFSLKTTRFRVPRNKCVSVLSIHHNRCRYPLVGERRIFYFFWPFHFLPNNRSRSQSQNDDRLGPRRVGGPPPPHTIGSATLTLSTVCVFRNGVDTDNIDESHLEEEVVEFLVKEEETVLQD